MSQILPLDTSVQAEYLDGYIHDETNLNDVSPYGPFEQDGELVDKNVFNDIIEKRPEAEHGPMVRFSVFYKNNRYDIDWRTVPANARPIRLRDGAIERNENGWKSLGWTGCRMGYQYTTELGENREEIQELQ